MKRLICVLFALLMLLSLAPVDTLGESQVIRVGLPYGQSSFAVPPDDAHLGFMMGTLDELSKYTNWTYEYVYDDPVRMLERLHSEEIDLIAGLYDRQFFSEDVLLSSYVSGYAYALLVSRPNDEAIQRNDFRSMQGKRIAAVAQTSEAERLLGYLALNSINNTIVYTSSIEESLQKLDKGEVDMALIGGDDARGNRIVTRFVVEPYYLAASTSRPDLVDQINSGYALILDSNPTFIDDLYVRYFGSTTIRDLQLTDVEKNYVAYNSPLRVVIPDHLIPLQSFADEGEAQGIAVDLLALIEERTGLSMQVLRAESIPDAIAMVEADQADAVLGLAVLPGENDLVMTNPYLDVYRVAVYNKYIEFPGDNLTIAIVPGMEYLIDDEVGEVIYADTFVECVSLVNNGTADYTYGSSYIVEYTTQNRTFHNVQTLTLPGVTDSLGLGLKRPVDSLLLTSLNKGILSITDEERQDIVMRNTTLKEQMRTLESFIYAYPVLVVVILSVLIGLIVVVTIIITMLRARHSKALYKSHYTDELTGALNLAGFRREAAHLLQTPENYALSYATIRNFQYINDRYGYEEGDRILRTIAEESKVEFRQNEAFCRVSGGTFIGLFAYATREELFARLDRFHAHLHTISPQADPGYHISLIAGVYLSENEPARNVMAMMDRANATRQRVKSSANITYAIYEEGTFDSIMHAQELESRMEKALEDGSFVVYLQPKMSLATLRPAQAEALVRWIDNGVLIPPDQFIPQFERNGFISRVDRHVFTQCCITLRRWLDTGMPVVPLSINVSRVQLYASDFIESYVAIKRKYDIPDGMLELEFTESILFEDVDSLIKIVEALRSNGFACSIDDFGKGYSSLTMLKNIPADSIKLDAMFFETGINQQRDTVIIESVVDIAKSLGMTSIAEGIEEKQQVTLLQMIGCDMAQGYVFSRPLPIDRFERYLHQKLLENKDPYAPLDETEGTAP